jgi:uncharacterized GH25 family protein
MNKCRPLLTSLLSLAFLGVTACPDALAHDILLLPSGACNGSEFTLTIKYGHPADYSLPEREKIFSLNIYPAGEAPAVSLLDKVVPATAETLAVKLSREQLGGPGIAIIGTQFDNGYYVETDKDHYYNTSKRELPKAEKSGHYLKFAKALVPTVTEGTAKLSGYDRVLGYRLELIPRANPFALKPGDELPVQVLFDGKPVGDGVQVDIISGEFPMTKGMALPTYKTDEHGVAQVKLERAGAQSVGADHIVTPSIDPELSDVDNYASSLSFVLPEK